GNNATTTGATPTPGTDPTLSSFAGGAQRVVSFTGSQNLQVNLNPLVGSPWTIVSLEVAQNLTNTSGGRVLLGNDFNGNGTDRVLGFGYRTDGDFMIQMYADDIDYAPGPFPFPAPRLWEGEEDPGFVQYLYLDGQLANERQAQNLFLSVAQGRVGSGDGGGAGYV